MDRKKLIFEAYNRSALLNLQNPIYLERVRDFTEKWLQEDVGRGDITTEALMLADKEVRAVIRAKSAGIIAGIEEAEWFYKNHRIQVKVLKKDGSPIERGDILLELKGSERDLLETERAGLNLLQRMSSIATLASKMVKMVRGRNVEIVPPRKNHWGLLDKKAVVLGGGLTHRLGLWESILIKENHLEAIRHEGIADCIEVALQRALAYDRTVFIEIEVENVEDCLKAARVFKAHPSVKPCIIMLDNFSVEETVEAVELLKKNRLRDHVIIESSGRITPDNLGQYAAAGTDVISMSYVTYAQNICDLSQRINRNSARC